MDIALTFERFDPPALATWLVGVRTSSIEERMVGGDSRGEAEANADESLARLLPGGVPLPGQLIGRVLSDDTPIGNLWIGPYGDDRQRWWVWDVAIDEGRRGQGYGRRAMSLAERLARYSGASTLGLNVFTANTAARASTHRSATGTRRSRCGRTCSHSTSPTTRLSPLAGVNISSGCAARPPHPERRGSWARCEGPARPGGARPG